MENKILEHERDLLCPGCGKNYVKFTRSAIFNLKSLYYSCVCDYRCELIYHFNRHISLQKFAFQFTKSFDGKYKIDCLVSSLEKIQLIILPTEKYIINTNLDISTECIENVQQLEYLIQELMEKTFLFVTKDFIPYQHLY